MDHLLHFEMDLLENKTWNLQLLSDIFHPYLVGKITGIHLALESDDDSWIWSPHTQGFATSLRAFVDSRGIHKLT